MSALFGNGTREPSYAAIFVGETFGPITITLDRAYLDAARFCLDDYAVARDAQGKQIVPGTAIARDLQQLFLTRYDPNRIVGLHQAEEIAFLAPVTLGESLTLTGSCVDKFEKRGKGYFVLDCQAVNARGETVVRQISTEIMEMPDLSARPAAAVEPSASEASASKKPATAPARHVSGVWPADREIAESYRPDLAPGTPVAPLVKACDLDRIAVFSGIGLGRYNTHTDIRVAQGAGFATALAQGMMETCWMSQMLAAFFGPEWSRGGWIRTNYLRPVLAGDTITLRAVFTGHGPEGAEVEVWAENQHQQMTAAGWARCRLPASLS